MGNEGDDDVANGLVLENGSVGGGPIADMTMIIGGVPVGSIVGSAAVAAKMVGIGVGIPKDSPGSQKCRAMVGSTVGACYSNVGLAVVGIHVESFSTV